MGSHVAAKAKRSRPQHQASLLDEVRDCWSILAEWVRLWSAGTLLAAKSVAAEWKDWPRGASTD